MHEDNPCVFVVDDDQSTRESLRNLLRSPGLTVQTFASAQEFFGQRARVPSCLGLMSSSRAERPGATAGTGQGPCAAAHHLIVSV